MPQVTVATFNCENLFSRFKFKGKEIGEDEHGNPIFRDWTPEELADMNAEGFKLDETKFVRLDPASRKLTKDAILATGADVIALQEVENLTTLRIFNEQYLGAAGYNYQILIDGNDPRGIDVAVLSRHPFVGLRTNHYLPPGSPHKVFSRDCLEVVVQVGDRQLALFVNHFKSMLGGRDETQARREQQSREVVRILRERYDDPGAHDWIVLGDLNDYLPGGGLWPLLDEPWLENVVRTRIADPDEQWTHHWDIFMNPNDEYRQLDYLLLSASLAEKNPDAVPRIERRGLPFSAARYAGPRFDGVGQYQPKSSDHCPVSIRLNL